VKEKLLLIGLGGHAKVILDAISLQNTYQPMGYIANQKNDETQLNYFGDISSKNLNKAKELGINHFIVAIGQNKIRFDFAKLAENEGLKGATIIHPKAIISKSVKIGIGTVIFANAVLNPMAIIRDHVIINTSSVVEHDCEINNYAQLAPNVSLGGGVIINEGVMVGIGAVIVPRIKIGEWATIGAGAVVTRSIKENVVAWGIPAKPVKNI
jgi:acetyltransferase EpsM